MLTRELNVINSPALSTEGGRRPIAVSGHSKIQHNIFYAMNSLKVHSLYFFFLEIKDQAENREQQITLNVQT